MYVNVHGSDMMAAWYRRITMAILKLVLAIPSLGQVGRAKLVASTPVAKMHCR